MKNHGRILLATLATFAFSSVTDAHPGHGVDSVTHYIVEPVHQLQAATWLLAIAFLVAMMLVSARQLRGSKLVARQSRRR